MRGKGHRVRRKPELGVVWIVVEAADGVVFDQPERVPVAERRTAFLQQPKRKKPA